MARPEKPPPVPQANTTNSMNSTTTAQPNTPAVPVMRRPGLKPIPMGSVGAEQIVENPVPAPNIPEVKAKTVQLDSRKVAKKRPEAPPLEL